MSDLLLEIGCENLPPHGIRRAYEQLREDAARRFEDLRLPFTDIYTTGTPRRLLLIVRGLADRQTAQSETVTGPPVSRAFDDSGAPTRAALGFAKANGTTVDKLGRIDTPRGEYLGFERRLKVQGASTLLRTALPELIVGLPFPKLMRWEDEDVRFARPIRWVVCLLGATVVRFSVAGVESGNVTHTVPWIKRDRIRVRSAAHYRKAVEAAGVILDHERRAAHIVRAAQAVAKREGLRLVDDPGLVEELTFMLENPQPIVGEFDRRYLELPPEIVITAMRAHQRYMAFLGRGRRLVPRFLTFTEGRVGSPATVRRGNEKVLKARLEDASFYWREDIGVGIEALSTRLDSIVFIEGLGSLGDKAKRTRSLARRIGEVDDSALDAHVIERAAGLAKADLASEMIKDGKEFTLLQGRIGSRYAAEAGEPDEIVQAIAEQYMPRGPADAVPASDLGTYLSLADRMDTIVGCFLAGLTPSGSQDPYALRRQANGVIRILEHRPRLSMADLIADALGEYGRHQSTSTSDDVREALDTFFRSRVETLLRDRGVAYDAVAAVSAVSWSTPAQAVERARAMEALRGDDAFELLITGAKRVGNILSPDDKRFGLQWPAVEEALGACGVLTERIRYDVSLFEDDAERQLHEAIGQSLGTIRAAERAGDAASVFAALGRLGPDIDRYFDAVLVNCPNDALRRNRHHFLAAVFALFSRYADFSLIVESTPTEP